MRVRIVKKCTRGCADCLLSFRNESYVGQVFDLERLTRYDEEHFVDERGRRKSKPFEVLEPHLNSLHIRSWCSREFSSRNFLASNSGYATPYDSGVNVRYIPEESGFFEIARSWRKL